MKQVVLQCCYNRQCCWNNMIESVSGGEEMSRSSRDLRTQRARHSSETRGALVSSSLSRSWISRTWTGNTENNDNTESPSMITRVMNMLIAVLLSTFFSFSHSSGKVKPTNSQVKQDLILFMFQRMVSLHPRLVDPWSHPSTPGVSTCPGHLLLTWVTRVWCWSTV